MTAVDRFVMCTCTVMTGGARSPTPGCPMHREPTTGSCRNCRRPVEWLAGVGWLHGELPQYAHEPITCESAIPVQEYAR